jgi:hypothetical protein
MNPPIAWLRHPARTALFLFVALGADGASLAAPPADPGRLFYTTAQRAQLEAARVRNVTQDRHAAPGVAAPDVAPPPQRFDGVVIRSDGSSTSWVNGQPQVGASGVAGLKPGQVRADGKVYEPYQVQRPHPAPPATEEPAP